DRKVLEVKLEQRGCGSDRLSTVQSWLQLTFSQNTVSRGGLSGAYTTSNNRLSIGPPTPPLSPALLTAVGDCIERPAERETNRAACQRADREDPVCEGQSNATLWKQQWVRKRGSSGPAERGEEEPGGRVSCQPGTLALLKGMNGDVFPLAPQCLLSVSDALWLSFAISPLYSYFHPPALGLYRGASPWEHAEMQERRLKTKHQEDTFRGMHMRG
ncbi:hypothetical protein KUCAC02_016587, partial [Chaenocephalus aceratus]